MLNVSFDLMECSPPSFCEDAIRYVEIFNKYNISLIKTIRFISLIFVRLKLSGGGSAACMSKVIVSESSFKWLVIGKLYCTVPRS